MYKSYPKYIILQESGEEEEEEGRVISTSIYNVQESEKPDWMVSFCEKSDSGRKNPKKSQILIFLK